MLKQHKNSVDFDSSQKTTFAVYGDFEKHEQNFNTFFSTTSVAVISLLIGGVLASLNFFNNTVTLFVLLILIAAPVTTFLMVFNESEFKTAYYKTWRDKFAGKCDQRKILRQFAKQYKIKNWRTKLDKIEADGRWNFRIETNYMANLTRQRDLLISRVNQEYARLLTAQNKRIITAKNEIANTKVETEMAKKKENNVKKMLDGANLPGETYKQRQNYAQSLSSVASCEQNENNAECNLRMTEQDEKELGNSYREFVYRIEKVYNARYEKYANSAIKKINRVNGLKYTIVDMPKSELLKK